MSCANLSPAVTPMRLRLRQAIALPVYTVALIPDYLAAALGTLAARIAGDDWRP